MGMGIGGGFYGKPQEESRKITHGGNECGKRGKCEEKCEVQEGGRRKKKWGEGCEKG